MENIGYVDFAIKILRRSFSKTMSKLEIYTLYLDMKLRRYGYLSEEDIQDVFKYADIISGENRYRLYLELAEYFYFRNDPCYQ